MTLTDWHMLLFHQKSVLKLQQQVILLSKSVVFCLLTGEREEKVGVVRKRKSRSTVQVFSTFKPSDYQDHHTKQHPSLWKDYQKC